MFAQTRFLCIQVLFYTFFYYWGQENRSLHRGLRYIQVRLIEVPLYEGLDGGGGGEGGRGNFGRVLVGGLFGWKN